MIIEAQTTNINIQIVAQTVQPTIVITPQGEASIPAEFEQRVAYIETTIEQFDGAISGATFTDYYNLAKN